MWGRVVEVDAHVGQGCGGGYPSGVGWLRQREAYVSRVVKVEGGPHGAGQ